MTRRFVLLFLLVMALPGLAAPSHLLHAGRWPIERLAFSPDGRCLLSADDDWVSCWDVASGHRIRRINVSDVIGVQGEAFSVDGSAVAVVTMPRDVDVFDVRNGGLRHEVHSKGFGHGAGDVRVTSHRVVTLPGDF